MQTGSEETADRDEPSAGHLGRDVAVYTLARFGMIAAAIGVLVLCHVPLLVAFAVAIVVVLPLSLLVLRGLRGRVASGLAARAEERAQLRAQLRG
ncbi:DUF4229 domain-containing protein [Solihabitans fulvus]|nr:DUF4229 domain-containing protein [Solihabitans fulvus]